MKEIISKEELERLKNLKGEARGMGIKSSIEFIIQKEGKEALEKIESEMKRIGYPIKYKEMKAMGFYPLGLEAALFLVIKKLFNYSDKDFQEMGRFGAKSSLIIRLFTQYFVSFEKFIDKPPEMWRKYFTVGNLKIQEYNEKEKYAIVRLGEFNLNRFHCQLFLGFCCALLEMMIKAKVTGQEMRCPFRGDEYHEFLLKW